MKRTRRFALIMAIFWTIVAVAAFVAVAGNWLRYYKTK